MAIAGYNEADTRSNPNEQKVVDARTPSELLQAIHDKGLEVDEALRQLRALVSAAND